MTHKEIREKFLKFFEGKGHKVVPSSSLLPTDPSVLFTTAGMQQFKPYYTGQVDAMRDFGSLNTASIQKCIRTSDIDEVGDERHLTFFEMLGNFSFGGYFKKEAIQYAFDFITKEVGLKIDYVSVLGGGNEVPADTESEEYWQEVAPGIDVRRFGQADNFWGPTGDEGPCGPTSEIYVDGIEIWNLVFNQYYQHKDGHLEPLKTPGIDTGMGLERLALVSQFPGQAGEKTVFETDLLEPVISILPTSLSAREKRIVTDHARASVFLISEGVRPSNKEQGYVLRRLLRRLMVPLASGSGIIDVPFERVIDEYTPIYPHLNKETILDVIHEEEAKFSRTLRQGLKELDKLELIDAVNAFRLYESFGLPYETIKDIAGDKASGLTREAFDTRFREHQEKSRAGAEKKFGGHGLLMDTGELKAGSEDELKRATRLHTATHLLQAALRQVLGDTITQAGSDITPERLRFDFSFPRKMTEDEFKKVEETVNKIIQKDMSVTKQTMTQEEAAKTGALHFFKVKYPPVVDVYSVGDFSKEFCGGPHVSHTGEIGKFSILKEEAVSAGIRRIRATVE